MSCHKNETWHKHTKKCVWKKRSRESAPNLVCFCLNSVRPEKIFFWGENEAAKKYMDERESFFAGWTGSNSVYCSENRILTGLRIGGACARANALCVWNVRSWWWWQYACDWHVGVCVYMCVRSCSCAVCERFVVHGHILIFCACSIAFICVHTQELSFATFLLFLLLSCCCSCW